MRLIGSRIKNAEDAWSAGQQLNVVASATTMASLLYASPAWWGYTSANDRARIDRLINRLRRGGYLSTDHPCFEKLANKADQRLFKAISANKNYVLAKYLYRLYA